MKKIIIILAVLLASTPAFADRSVPHTVDEFLKMSDSDTTYVLLKGVITRTRNCEKGNVFISDGTGTVLIYGFSSRDNKGMKELDVRKGDTLTVSGRRFVYNGKVIEMKYARYICHAEGPGHAKMKYEDELDKMPSFKGKGTKAFSQWVSAHLVFPKEARDKFSDGSVKVKFVVGRDGKVYEPKILESAGKDLDNEVLRVISSAPKWKPGIVDGHPVRVTFEMYVHFVNQY